MITKTPFLSNPLVLNPNSEYHEQFYKKEGRLPKAKEMPFAHALNDYGGKKQIFKLALSQDGYTKIEMRFSYTDQELLRFLRIFREVNKRKPSYSDCKRGLLPNLSRYTYRFGSWKKALKLSGTPGNVQI